MVTNDFAVSLGAVHDAGQDLAEHGVFHLAWLSIADTEIIHAEEYSVNAGNGEDLFHMLNAGLRLNLRDNHKFFVDGA